MAKRRKKRKSSFPGGRLKRGRAYYCRKVKPANCTVKIGARRYAAKSCITAPVTVCPKLGRGRRKYTMSTASGSVLLHKVPKKRRARARR